MRNNHYYIQLKQPFYTSICPSVTQWTVVIIKDAWRTPTLLCFLCRGREKRATSLVGSFENKDFLSWAVLHWRNWTITLYLNYCVVEAKEQNKQLRINIPTQKNVYSGGLSHSAIYRMERKKVPCFLFVLWSHWKYIEILWSQTQCAGTTASSNVRLITVRLKLLISPNIYLYFTSTFISLHYCYAHTPMQKCRHTDTHTHSLAAQRG